MRSKPVSRSVPVVAYVVEERGKVRIDAASPRGKCPFANELEDALL
jgi:hypothetical protein